MSNSARDRRFSWVLAPRAGVQRYVTAVTIAAIAIGLRYLFAPYLGNSSFAIFLIALVTAAWFGGLGPSLVSQTMLLVATALLFSSNPKPPGHSVLHGLISITAFYGLGCAIALLSDSRRRAQQRERQQQREAIAQREQLKATVSCMGDGVLVTNAEGRITLMNPAAEQLTGRSIAESVGELLGDVFTVVEEGAEATSRQPIEPTSCNASPAATALVLLNRKGQEVPITYTAATIREPGDDAQRTLGHVLVVRDETDRRRIERALREADRKKDEFLATLAHELRNPLAPICAGLELLKIADQSPQQVSEVHSVMERQTKHMVRLIDDLLDLSRITRGRLELRKCPVLLTEIVQDALEATRPIVEQAGHHLVVHLPSRPVVLMADPSRLTQVLGNLLSNAAKYTPSGGRIGLTAEQSDGRLTMQVRDNGMGIPPEKFEYVFEMFAQVNGTAEHGHTGLGIGLTLVKRLVEMHGGTVEVASAGRNQGSTFKVCLPVLTPQSESASPAKPNAQIAANSVALRVLVADDNADVVRTMSRMVQALGHEVHTALDGQQAVEAVQSFTPDIVLMDLGMPNLNGYEAAEAIRQQSNLRQPYLVAITGWGQDDDRARTKQAGFDCHLLKPVDLNSLRKLLEDRAKTIKKPHEFAGAQSSNGQPTSGVRS